MSSPSALSGGDSSRRARSNTSTTRPLTSPSDRNRLLTRSKSVGAITKPAPSHKEWPAERLARSGSTGGHGPPDVPPLPGKDTRHQREAVDALKLERPSPKTLARSASAGIGALGNRNRELTSGDTGTGTSTNTGAADTHTNTFISIAAKVRPKLASFTNLRRSKSHHFSKSVSSSPSTNSPLQMPFIYEGPEEPVPPLPVSFARLVPREPVVRRSISLYDVKGELKPSRPPLSKSSTLPPPLPRFSGEPHAHEREVAPSHRSVSHSPTKTFKKNPGAQGPLTSPIRTVNRHATVYAPAPSVPLPSSSSSRPAKHLVKPSLSLTLPNGISIVHEPLLFSPISSSFRSNTTTPMTPPPSRPPPRAHLPESPMSFNIGFDIKPEAWDAPGFSSPSPSASFSVASYYYASTEANTDYHDVITRYIELGDMESVRSFDICNNGGWSAPGSHLKAPHARPGGSLKSPAQLLPLDRGSVLPPPEPIGNGKFPPLPPPPTYNKKLPPTPTARDVEQYADDSTQVLRLQRSQSYRSRLTPVTPDTPALLTPKGNMPLPTLAPWPGEEITYLPNQDVSIIPKQPPLKIRSKRNLSRSATGF